MRLKQYAAQNGGSLNELVSLPPSLIQVEPGFNPRIEDDRWRQHVREIADSIKANGYDQTQILVVKWSGEHVFVRDGHCRLAAIALAVSEGAVVERVPVQPLPRGSDEIDEAYQVLTTQTKLPLAPLEFAAQLKKLLARGQKISEIASRLGRSREIVERALLLAEAPAEVRDAVTQHAISSTEAVKVLRNHGERAGPVITAAREAARESGKTRVTAKTIESVLPRTERVSLHTLVKQFLDAWEAWEAMSEHGVGADVDTAISALRESMGPLHHG